MLEQERLSRAYAGAKKYPEWPEAESLELFLREEMATQNALEAIGAKNNSIPSEVYKVGKMFMVPELIENLRIPYAVEVVGMPAAGKTTMITRYLEEQWGIKRRHLFAYVDEGARAIKEKYGDLRYSDPFTYSVMGTSRSFRGIIDSTDHINAGLRVVISDRGQQDRRVFKRALFLQGKVDPLYMSDVSLEVDKLVDTPIQLGGTIMFMVRPETTIKRTGRLGPVVNPENLPYLYEQYWRLHWELVQNEVPYRIYTCIDAEKSKEEVYERFKYAVDSIFNLHTTMLAAIYKLLGKEADKIAAEVKRNPRLGYAERVLGKALGGKKVIILGGDDLVDTNDILKKPFVEGKFLKK